MSYHCLYLLSLHSLPTLYSQFYQRGTTDSTYWIQRPVSSPFHLTKLVSSIVTVDPSHLLKTFFPRVLGDHVFLVFILPTILFLFFFFFHSHLPNILMLDSPGMKSSEFLLSSLPFLSLLFPLFFSSPISAPLLSTLSPGNLFQSHITYIFMAPNSVFPALIFPLRKLSPWHLCLDVL